MDDSVGQRDGSPGGAPRSARGGTASIERALREWTSALDVIDDLVFLHDRAYRILRCNEAYRRRAGLPFQELLGRPYYEVFPKRDGPLRSCAQEARGDAGEPLTEELVVGTETYRSHAYAVRDERGHRVHTVHVLRDITRRRGDEERLRQSKELLGTIIGTAPVRIFWKGRDLRYLGCNVLFARDAGFEKPEDLIGKTDHDMVWSEQAHRYQADDKRVIESGEPRLGIEEPQTTPRGDLIWLSTSKVPLRDSTGRIFGMLGIYQDVSKRKLAEDRLRESEAFVKTVLDNLPLGVAVNTTDPFVVFDYMNDEFPRLYRTTRETLEIPGSFWEAAYEDPETRERIQKQALEDCASGDPERMRWNEVPIARRGEETRYISARNVPLPQKGMMISIAWDVTERKLAQDALRASEQRYRSLFAGMMNGFAYCRMICEDGRPSDFVFLETNEAFERQTGLRDVVGKRASEVIAGIREKDPDLLERYGRVASGGGSERFEVFVQALNMWFSISVYSPQAEHFVAVFDVITQRKEQELAMRRANRALEMIRKCNSMLFHCEEEAEMLSSLCRIAVETGGYLMATVAFAEDDPGKTVRPVAQSGHDEGYLETAHFTWADTERGRGPTGTAVRTGRTVVNQDIHTNPAMRPWLDQAIARGYQASVALPLVGDRRVLGALTIFAVEPHAFGDEEVSLLEELANELAYGIVSLRTRRAHEQHQRVLRKSLEQSIQTIADTVEARDPYTAGHQRRVAALAVAIAEEMDVPAEARNGLRLAATIHDLGKIGVPVEILAKPGKLTATEYEIIKTHPQHGHDILQGVEFPWPIADIIFQHHERMDGSGYPQGLAGDAILPEARILAVADVVEAMASHRPYRPGLGIDAALEEVTRNRGRLYDEQVVDACLRLIRDHGYVIDD